MPADMDAPGPPEEDSYMMGRSQSETRRLVRQSGFYGPFTQSLLTRAGLGPGMTVALRREP